MGNTQITHKRIDKYTLLKDFKMFKRTPQKVFVVGDFTGNNQNRYREQYLHTLTSLGLIEKVNAIYKFGRKYAVIGRIKGYKLIKCGVKNGIKKIR